MKYSGEVNGSNLARAHGLPGCLHAMDPSEVRFQEYFFTGPALERSLVAMCSTAKHAVDPIAHVILQVVSSHLQVQLTATGLQPIAGRDLLIQYHMMSTEQREFILGMVRERDR